MAWPGRSIDTSALVAILRDEPDAGRYALAIEQAADRRISAATYVEVGAVIDGARDPVASRRVDELLQVAGIVIEPVTAEHARRAREAYRDFGRGSGHPARLNFGDCCSYALATSTGDALLFKGDDFALTDVTQQLVRPPPLDLQVGHQAVQQPGVRVPELLQLRQGGLQLPDPALRAEVLLAQGSTGSTAGSKSRRCTFVRHVPSRSVTNVSLR